MISNEEKEGWHYFTVKKLSTLLRGITSKYDGHFCCLNCLHSFRTKNQIHISRKSMQNRFFRNSHFIRKEQYIRI